MWRVGAGGEGAEIEQSENANAGAGTCVRETMRVGLLQSIRGRGSGEWEWLGTRADPIELFILRESNIFSRERGERVIDETVELNHPKNVF
jgi:hypothetical protein